MSFALGQWISPWDGVARGANPEEAFSSDSFYTGNAAYWAQVVEGIQQGDSAAMEAFYAAFDRGLRIYLGRQMGIQDVDDKIHEIFVIIISAIQRGELREPDRLMGYVRTVARRQVAAHIGSVITKRRGYTGIDEVMSVPDRRENVEERLLGEQKIRIMERILEGISNRDRELLTRFYLNEQPLEQICEEMGLTETQFRLMKSRAKARFTQMGKKKVVGRADEQLARPTAMQKAVGE